MDVLSFFLLGSMEVIRLPEVTEKEYRAKERQRDKYQREKKAYEKKISSLNDEIAELDRAIKRMTQVYQSFKAQVGKLDGVLDEKREFIGNQYKKLVVNEGNLLASEGKRCQMNVINKVLDELEWLRNEKRRKRNEQYGLLGHVQSSLSSVRTWLRTNFFNN